MLLEKQKYIYTKNICIKNTNKFIESLLSNFDGGQKKLSLVIKIHSFTDLQNHQKTQIPR